MSNEFEKLTNEVKIKLAAEHFCELEDINVSGISVSDVGDMNEDSRSDFLVVNTDKSYAELIYGSKNFLETLSVIAKIIYNLGQMNNEPQNGSQELTDAERVKSTLQEVCLARGIDMSGISVSNIGKMTKDGYGEFDNFIVTNANNSRANIIFGKENFIETLADTLSNQSCSAMLGVDEVTISGDSSLS